MNLTSGDMLAAAQLVSAILAAALYAAILLARGQRRNGRVEILICAGVLVMLALVSRSLTEPQHLLYCGAAGALLVLLVLNQWRWHLRTRGAR